MSNACDGCGTGGPFTSVYTTNGRLRLCEQCLGDVNRKSPILADLRRRLDEAVGLLRELEWWSHGGGIESCPVCKMSSNAGHAVDCRIAAWLATNRAELKP